MNYVKKFTKKFQSIQNPMSIQICSLMPTIFLTKLISFQPKVLHEKNQTPINVLQLLLLKNRPLSQNPVSISSLPVEPVNCTIFLITSPFHPKKVLFVNKICFLFSFHIHDTCKHFISYTPPSFPSSYGQLFSPIHYHSYESRTIQKYGRSRYHLSSPNCSRIPLPPSSIILIIKSVFHILQ